MLKQVLLGLLLVATAGLSAPAAEPEKSVIQITTFSQQPTWDTPWQFDAVRKSSGTGFVVRGRRILTNAHVVSWARQILVRRYQDARPYQAQPTYVAHDCDLALLDVEDPAFFNGLEPLDFGDLPQVRSAVVTYGYPAGGEQISYTRGVVSRIELQPFTHIGNRGFLAVQTDAAINPGNSGGPVIQDDKVVGIAFQGIAGLENTGFFIPSSVARHVFKDIEDGVYDGFPQAGLRLAPMQNPAYRRYLKLPDTDLGVRIDRINPIPDTQRLLREDDVLVRVGDYAVAFDGTIVYEGNRVSAAVALSQAQKGESMPIQIWRGGQEMSLALPLQIFREDLAEGNQFTLPRYFVYAGLVFTPLSRDYLKTFGPNWADAASAELIYELLYRRTESPDTWRPEPVVLSTTLAHAVNANLTIRGRALIDKINGKRIEKMEDVVRALETSDGVYDVIEFVSGNGVECLDRAEARKAGPQILQTYGIAKDRRL